MNWTIGYAVNSILFWDKNLEGFVPIVSSVNSTPVVKSFRDPKSLNLNKIPIKIGYPHVKNFFEFRDNDTRITGYLGDIWSMIAHYVNFTLIPVRTSRNDTRAMNLNETDIIAVMRYSSNLLKLVDFTVPLFTSCFRLYVPENYHSDGSWLSKMISLNVCLSIIAFIIVFSTLSYGVSCYYNLRNPFITYRMTFKDHLFATFATFCNQADGFLPEHVEDSFRIMTITKSLFAWLLITILSSGLWELMSKKQDIVFFPNIVSFFETTNYKLIVPVAGGAVNYLMEHYSECYERGRENGRLLIVSDVSKIYINTFFKTRKAAVWMSEYTYYTTGQGFGLIPMTKCSTISSFAAVTTKSFSHSPAINTAILKLKETGIFNGVKQRWFNHQDSAASNTYVGVGVHELHKIFLIYGLGTFASLLILIQELIRFAQAANAFKLKRKP